MQNRWGQKFNGQVSLIMKKQELIQRARDASILSMFECILLSKLWFFCFIFSFVLNKVRLFQKTMFAPWSFDVSLLKYQKVNIYSMTSNSSTLSNTISVSIYQVDWHGNCQNNWSI